MLRTTILAVFGLLIPILGAEASPSLSQAEIEVFTASRCKQCEWTVNRLREQGTTFLEHDLETDASAEREYLQSFGRGLLPVVRFDGRFFRGYQPDELDTMVQEVRQRSLPPLVEAKPLAKTSELPAEAKAKPASPSAGPISTRAQLRLLAFIATCALIVGMLALLRRVTAQIRVALARYFEDVIVFADERDMILTLGAPLAGSVGILVLKVAPYVAYTSLVLSLALFAFSLMRSIHANGGRWGMVIGVAKVPLSIMVAVKWFFVSTAVAIRYLSISLLYLVAGLFGLYAVFNLAERDRHHR